MYVRNVENLSACKYIIDSPLPQVVLIVPRIWRFFVFIAMGQYIKEILQNEKHSILLCQVRMLNESIF